MTQACCHFLYPIVLNPWCEYCSHTNLLELSLTDSAPLPVLVGMVIHKDTQKALGSPAIGTRVDLLYTIIISNSQADMQLDLQVDHTPICLSASRPACTSAMQQTIPHQVHKGMIIMSGSRKH